MTPRDPGSGDVPPPGGPHGDLAPGPPGRLLRIVRDQRVAFVLVGVANTAIGFLCFVLYQATVGTWWGYMWTLLFAHLTSVLAAFVLYRRFVFLVHGNVLRDLWRFETVYLTAVAFNAVALPILVQLAHLQVLVAQALIVLVTSLMSWVGHRHYSFRRPSVPAAATAPLRPTAPGPGQEP